MKNLWYLLLLSFISGCATTQVSDRCLSYTISGGDYPWRPTNFYRTESNQNRLYIQIPQSARYIPQLEVIDTEFDQPYKIDYTFDSLTHRFSVEDNHDQYLLYRKTYDELEKEEVYITCNRIK